MWGEVSRGSYNHAWRVLSVGALLKAWVQGPACSGGLLHRAPRKLQMINPCLNLEALLHFQGGLMNPLHGPFLAP